MKGLAYRSHHWRSLLFYLLCVWLLSGCGRPWMRSKIKDSGHLSTRSMGKSQVATIFLKANLRYENNKFDFPAIVHLRIRKDSLVWVSLASPIGIELFRLMADQEHIQLLDRLKRRHLTMRYAELASKWQLPDLNYRWLECLLLGKALLRPEAYHTIRTAADTTTTIHLQATHAEIVVNTWLEPLNEQVIAQSISDTAGRKLSINYQYALPHKAEKKQDKPLPYPRTLHLELTHAGAAVKEQEHANKEKLQLTYQQINFIQGTPSFPFKIPERYEKIPRD